MTTTKKNATKAHPDGGTVETIAFHSRPNGWGVAIQLRTGYRGNCWYEVARVSPDNFTFCLRRAGTEREARTIANQVWVDEGR